MTWEEWERFQTPSRSSARQAKKRAEAASQSTSKPAADQFTPKPTGNTNITSTIRENIPTEMPPKAADKCFCLFRGDSNKSQCKYKSDWRGHKIGRFLRKNFAEKAPVLERKAKTEGSKTCITCYNVLENASDWMIKVEKLLKRYFPFSS